MVARRRKREASALQAPPSVLRRRADGARGIRKLPADLEDLASGRRDVLRPRRKPRGRIGDSRVAGLVPGVANHEARRVYDARLERAAAASAAGDETTLAGVLCEAVLLGLWRARAVTGFEALAQAVLGIEPARAVALAEAAAAQRGVVLERLPDIAVALWMRGEAALLDRCPDASLRVNVANERVALHLDLPLAPVERTAEAVSAIGRAAGGLGRVLELQQSERIQRRPDKPPQRGDD
jgi:hypothetical protein